ncbi:MAG: TOBE domain-containing protein [Armatimonadota bacterium]
MPTRRAGRPRGATRLVAGPSVYLTAQDVARLLRLNVKRVQVLARTGRLPTIRVGRKWLFPRAQLLESLHGTPVEGADSEVAISARNRLRGRITSMSVDGVMAEVRIGVGDQELVSIITRASAEHMRLRVGDPVVAVIKATEVMVGKVLGPRAR